MNPHAFPTCHERFGFSDRTIERFLCNDLPAEEQTRVQTAVDASPALAVYVAERRRQKAAFGSLHPFAAIRGKIERPESAALWRSLPAAWLRPGLVALSLAAVIGGTLVFMRSTEDPRIRVRGGVAAKLIVKRQARTFEAAPEVALRPGDQIRIQLDDPEGGFVYVLGLDQRGSIAFYHGGAAANGDLRISSGTTVLPDSLTLDDSPINEVLVVVLSKDRRTSNELREWLHTAATGEVFPPHLEPLPHARVAVIPIFKALP